MPFSGVKRENKKIRNLPEAKGLSKAEKAELEKVYFQKLIDLYVEYRWYTGLRSKSYGNSTKHWDANTPDKFRIIKNDNAAEDLVETATYVAKVYLERSKKNVVDFYLDEKKRAETRDTDESRFKDRVEGVLDSSIDTLKGQIGAKYGFDSEQFELGLTYTHAEDLIRLRDRSMTAGYVQVRDESYAEYEAKRNAKRITGNGIEYGRSA